MTEKSELLEFAVLFNREQFFEAHEALEKLWRQDTGEARDFYQGLIQIAALFVHLQRGTPDGAEKLFKKASEHLEKYRPVYRGLDLERFLQETEASLHQGKAFPLCRISEGESKA